MASQSVVARSLTIRLAPSGVGRRMGSPNSFLWGGLAPYKLLAQRKSIFRLDKKDKYLINEGRGPSINARLGLYLKRGMRQVYQKTANKIQPAGAGQRHVIIGAGRS